MQEFEKEYKEWQGLSKYNPSFGEKLAKCKELLEVARQDSSLTLEKYQEYKNSLEDSRVDHTGFFLEAGVFCIDSNTPVNLSDVLVEREQLITVYTKIINYEYTESTVQEKFQSLINRLISVCEKNDESFWELYHQFSIVLQFTVFKQDSFHYKLLKDNSRNIIQIYKAYCRKRLELNKNDLFKIGDYVCGLLLKSVLSKEPKDELINVLGNCYEYFYNKDDEFVLEILKVIEVFRWRVLNPEPCLALYQLFANEEFDLPLIDKLCLDEFCGWAQGILDGLSDTDVYYYFLDKLYSNTHVLYGDKNSMLSFLKKEYSILDEFKIEYFDYKDVEKSFVQEWDKINEKVGVENEKEYEE